MERWAPILGYPDYEVSTHGRIYSLVSHRELRQSYGGKGYLKVNLYNTDGGKTKFVHRLVAETFLDMQDLEVNHIDGNKENNRVENLEPATRLENVRHSWRAGLSSSRHLHVPVRCVETGEVFYSISAAADRIGARPGNVHNVIHGRSKTVRGYTFQLVEDRR